jgi:hypothetical protein
MQSAREERWRNARRARVSCRRVLSSVTLLRCVQSMDPPIPAAQWSVSARVGCFHPHPGFRSTTRANDGFCYLSPPSPPPPPPPKPRQITPQDIHYKPDISRNRTLISRSRCRPSHCPGEIHLARPARSCVSRACVSQSNLWSPHNVY